jgi:hypothetical protein
MFGLARFVRKQRDAEVEVEGSVTVDLEEFLRGASPIVDEKPAPAREGALSEPPPALEATLSEPPLDLDARLDEALRQTFPASDPIAVSPAGEQLQSAVARLVSSPPHS